MLIIPIMLITLDSAHDASNIHDAGHADKQIPALEQNAARVITTSPSFFQMPGQGIPGQRGHNPAADEKHQVTFAAFLPEDRTSWL